MDTQQFNFDDGRREQFVRLAELSDADHGLVRTLQQEVIAPHAADIVEAFYEHLSREPEADTVLPTSGARIDNLKNAYRRYLLSFGVQFQSSDYFRERLRIGAMHAAVGVPLRLYVAAGRVLQQLIIDHVLAGVLDARRRRALLDLVLKLTTLDNSLAIEAYHGTRVGALESSVEMLRARQEKLAQDLSTDALTGVASRRSVLDCLQRALEHARHEAKSVGVIVLDLDHFKSINDRHGHAAGDKVLQVAAARIRSSLRPMDTVGRYGGEEFLMILPATDSASSARVAVRVRRNLGADLVNANGVTIRVTASQGIAVSDGSEDPDAVVERADRALYAAKRAGRDCVVSADGGSADASAPALGTPRG